ncbi:MAG: (2Fe-2S)-binding protein, partial [Cyanobacteria bacterium J06632_22]
KNPALLAIPKVIDAHLENIFPSIVIFHGTSAVGKAAQCHLFVPEGEGRTRTYVLLYVQTQNPLAPLLKQSFLKLPQVVVEQDVDILNKLYPDAPQRIRLNNEVGMDWVRRNFKHWPYATVAKSTPSA